ncbi:MAG: hypothetical protein IRF6MM_06610 [Candidatus Midichloria mitochondrii]
MEVHREDVVVMVGIVAVARSVVVVTGAKVLSNTETVLESTLTTTNILITITIYVTYCHTPYPPPRTKICSITKLPKNHYLIVLKLHVYHR